MLLLKRYMDVTCVEVSDLTALESISFSFHATLFIALVMETHMAHILKYLAPRL